MKTLHSDFHICIIGAGIVGLTGGILFRRQGFKVTIIEKDSGLQTIGAGLQLHPNALHVLQDIDVYEKVKANSIVAPAIILKDYATGQNLHKQDLRDVEGKYGAPVLTVHRAHLRQILYEEAVARGVHFEFGLAAKADGTGLARAAVSLCANGKPTKSLSADLFVCADGANSVLRETLIGRKSELVPHGKVCYRIVFDEHLVRERENLRHLVEDKDIVVWMGSESQAVTYILAGIYNIAITRPCSLDPAEAFSGPQAVDLKEFLAELSSEGWDAELLELVSLGGECKRWMFFQPQIDDENSPWVDVDSKFCLVGDAAHQTLPYLAQGAAMGLESISVLSRLLGKAQNRSQVIDCLRLYQSMRKERTGHVIRASLKNGANWMLPNGPLREERNRVFLYETPTAGCPNLLADPFFQSWLWGFDASKAADEAWELHMKPSAL